MGQKSIFSSKVGFWQFSTFCVFSCFCVCLCGAATKPWPGENLAGGSALLAKSPGSRPDRGVCVPKVPERHRNHSEHAWEDFYTQNMNFRTWSTMRQTIYQSKVRNYQNQVKTHLKMRKNKVKIALFAIISATMVSGPDSFFPTHAFYTCGSKEALFSRFRTTPPGKKVCQRVSI